MPSLHEEQVDALRRRRCERTFANFSDRPTRDCRRLSQITPCQTLVDLLEHPDLSRAKKRPSPDDLVGALQN